MGQRVTAIFEKGVLKPLVPLDLRDEEVVSLFIEKFDDNGSEIDGDEYLPLIAEDGDPSVTWEEIQAVLAKLPGPLSEDFDRERDERF